MNYFAVRKMNENMTRLMLGLDNLTRQMDAQKYLSSNVLKRPELTKQTNQLDALKYLTCDVLEHLEGGDIIIIDNCYVENTCKNPYNKASTYVGYLKEDFIPTDPLMLDEYGPRIKIQFQPGTLKRLAYDAKNHTTSLWGVPWSVDSIYPSSKILFEYDEVIERLKSEHCIEEDYNLLMKNK